ncbi:MAG TPA: phosphotransferase [Streptosporangiaceae bacterium]|nr:phosphotransferase [Streptosporangiaceae bacterium]
MGSGCDPDDHGQMTHDVRIDRERSMVTKWFRSWSRGEPLREWRALCLLADHAPGLAPEPVGARLTGPVRAVTMSLLPGEPLGGTAMTEAQLLALARELDRLWRCALPGRLAWEACPTLNAVAFSGLVRDLFAAVVPPRGDAVVRRAVVAARSWLASTSSLIGPLDGHGIVFGQGDSNLANFLWDGERVQLVDFEDSGPSDRAFELAGLVEHLSARVDSRLDSGAFAAMFDLTVAERARLVQARRVAAAFWLALLQPGSSASKRNPPGTLRRQAEHVLALIG